jgi:hypothetical protein
MSQVPTAARRRRTFAGDANHEGSSDSKSITITKASSATAVSCPASVTYDGSPLTPCTAIATGVGGLGQPLAVGYANNTNAGTATASASFAGDANHTGSSDSRSFTINKASSSTVVTVAGGESFTYDGLPHPATVLVTGAGSLSLAPAPIYNCGHVPVDVADSGCTASYVYPGDANHTGSADAKTYAIGRRSAAVTPNSASKFLGNSDPVPLTSGTLAGFVGSDGIAATYARTPGETLAGSPYAIGATLSPAAKLANYDIAYNTASFHILAVSVTGPVGPLAKGNAATVAVSFPDSGTQAGPVCTFDWDDGSTSAVAATNAGGNWTCTLARTYSAAGVYEVEVTVTDASSGSTMVAFQYVVIYDAGAGFVTGGGWINSPPGAYVGTTLTGKANFGFVSKYKNGQSVPSGETEFQFKAGGFNFHSTVYDWLVIAGAKAQYKGSGKVNDAGDYGFLLTATDGKANGGGGVDKFRIKIWNKASGAIVYDNNLAASDDIDSANPQALGGGSITIHK